MGQGKAVVVVEDVVVVELVVVDVEVVLVVDVLVVVRITVVDVLVVLVVTVEVLVVNAVVDVLVVKEVVDVVVIVVETVVDVVLEDVVVGGRALNVTVTVPPPEGTTPAQAGLHVPSHVEPGFATGLNWMKYPQGGDPAHTPGHDPPRSQTPSGGARSKR